MRSFLVSTSALVAIAMAAPAYAQNASETEDNGSEIIVTARKFEERLVDVPVPVSVTTAEQLGRDQVYSVTDLQRVTPALEISQTSGGEVNGGARLRGLGTGVFNASVSPSVAFIVDQVPQGNLTFPILFDIGQVEVLRGPQGTLFGQGASAGVINISTVEPSTSGISASGGIDFADKGTAGSEVGELTMRGAFNLPLGDKAAIRFAAHYKRELGLQRNTALGLDNDIRELGLRVRALIRPSDTVKIVINGEYARQRSRGWNFFAIATTPNATNLIDPDGPGPAPTLPVSVFSTGDFTSATGCKIPAITARAEFYCEDTQASLTNEAAGVSTVIDVELSDAVTLTSVTAYRELDRETETVNFSRRLGVGARNENIEGESRQFSQELRVAYDSEALKLVVGGLYSGFRLRTTPIDNTLPFGNAALGKRTGFSVCQNAGAFCVVPVALTYEDTKNNTLAAFADATFSLTEQLDLFGGIRYTDYSNTTGVGNNTNYATRVQKIDDNNLSGRVGLSFKPNTDTTLFASYARGYKPPAIVVPTIATDPVTVLKPEKADAFEIGAKMQMGRMQLSANAFYSKVNNFQTQSSVFNTAGALISVTQNISNVTSKGFELGIFGQVTDQISINAGYQFNDVRFPTGFVGNDGISLANTQFLNAPKHKFTFSGEFVQPMGGNLELFANTNVVWKSAVLLAQYGNPAYRYPAHAIINGGFGLRDADGKWTLSVFARNLTKQREPTAYLASDFAGTPDGGIRAWPAAGLTARVVGVSAGFKF
ncbi:TonB-dependent receptor domain-containing protein [Novosphingobium sp.]|uniref:TonB-dependent receptor n=1 Tax=Novosphingobium sp. TaxID=1874826 RepID=UPI00286E5FA4|nr:TonB-dependent receptor [Novosphingobium sp.]